MSAIILENVSVDFPIYGTRRSFRKALFERATGGFVQQGDRHHHDRLVVKALTDISLRLEDGDRVGLIGHNGSGKSTLLKVMAGIYEPTRGRVLAQGEVTPLFESMPGLDYEDTGYENVITAGMLLGMSRAEIEGKIPEIEEFSELGEYFNLPVRTYSTGMQTRLGFALATAVKPGILLMDEGLATGDARFAERAAKRMESLISRSPILVLASHMTKFVEAVCNKAILMQAGRIVFFGAVKDVVEQYRLRSHAQSVAQAQTANGARAQAEPESSTVASARMF